MTVKELKEALENADDNLEVVISDPNGFVYFAFNAEPSEVSFCELHGYSDEETETETVFKLS